MERIKVESQSNKHLCHLVTKENRQRKTSSITNRTKLYQGIRKIILHLKIVLIKQTFVVNLSNKKDKR